VDIPKIQGWAWLSPAPGPPIFAIAPPWRFALQKKVEKKGVPPAHRNQQDRLFDVNHKQASH